MFKPGDRLPDGSVIEYVSYSYPRKGSQEPMKAPAAVAKVSPATPEPEKPMTKKDVEEAVDSTIHKHLFWTTIVLCIFELLGWYKPRR